MIYWDKKGYIRCSTTNEEEEKTAILMEKLRQHSMDKISEPGKNVSRLLEGILSKYDTKIRPYYGGKVTHF